MKIFHFSILTLITVICVLLLYADYYYNKLILFEKNGSGKLYKPVFEDMISLVDDNIIINDSDDWPLESEILSTLEEALKTSLIVTTESPIYLKGNSLVTESEIDRSLQAAIHYRASGNIKKASKLFQHVVSIAPDNADVLNHYGEFIEYSYNDILTADELYCKALMHCPDHIGASKNRERTAHIVDKIEYRILKSIDEKRDLFIEIDEKKINPKINNYLYYLHLYHTVAIEGNTMTLEQLIHVLRTGRVVPDKSIFEHNEVLGIELAMVYVKTLSRFPNIGINEILEIHRRILGYVDPLNSGTFRKQQVFVGSHVPPSPDDIEHLMENYIEWLNSYEAQNMHPVRYAALAHYKLVDIHPFIDGNGRTSRLIMNLILLRAGYPPVVIIKSHREKYYQYLKFANTGDVRPFIRFIARCTENMIDIYLWSRGILRDEITHVQSNTIQIDKNVKSITNVSLT